MDVALQLMLQEQINESLSSVYDIGLQATWMFLVSGEYWQGMD